MAIPVSGPPQSSYTPAQSASAAAARAARSGAVTSSPSDRGLVTVAGPDPDDGVDRGHPDLAVADPAGLRGADDRVDDRVDVGVVDDDLDPDLGHQRDVVLRAPVDLGMALL